MPAKTISQLTQATAINNADEFAIEQGGVTKRVAASVVRGDIVNANIKSDAAIAFSKLAALNSAQILVGNGSNVATAVSVTGDVTISNSGVTAIAAGAIATADIADAAVTPAKLSQKLTFATEQASTSGTSIDFTGIPSWAKRITIMFQGVSTSGSSAPQVQLGAGSITSSGYLGTNSVFTNGGTLVAVNFTTGFGIGVNASNWGASAVFHGHLILTCISGNSWVASGVIALSSGATNYFTAGSVSLAGTLDQVRVTTVNGTDTFDAGTINISYEG